MSIFNERRDRIFSVIDPDILGIWKLGNNSYEFTSDGFYKILSDPISYQISEPTLKWGQQEFSRVYGDANEIFGVWKEVQNGEEYFFRKSMWYTYHDSDVGEYFGTFIYNRVNQTLGTHEIRAKASTKNKELKLDTYYQGSFTYIYSVKNSELILKERGSNTRIIFHR